MNPKHGYEMQRRLKIARRKRNSAWKPGVVDGFILHDRGIGITANGLAVPLKTIPLGARLKENGQ